MDVDDQTKTSAIRRIGAAETNRIAGYEVLRKEMLDGTKLFLVVPEEAGCSGTGVPAAETWLLLRTSGTEPLLRIYCESSSQRNVDEILEAAKHLVMET